MSELTIAKAYVQIVPSTKGIKGSLESSLGAEATSAGKSAGASFTGAMGTALKAGVATLGAVSAVAGTFVKTAVEGFSEYEQLVGGVETLFGNQGMNAIEYAQSVGKSFADIKDEYIANERAQKIVLDNASNAYKTAGLSANEYMETVTSFAAALTSSLNGDSVSAAKAANLAITDMSDNANKMGSSMESIQNAYQGFSKQNYTMLDNLKLGYGGTKEEMQRLLTDAEKLPNAMGKKFDISNYADVVEAIHLVQENMGITGTTAKEASTTIQGSLGMVKSAWANLVTGMATDGANLDDLIANFTDSVSAFAGNVIPVAETALGGITELIGKLAPIIAEAVPSLVSKVLPQLIKAGYDILSALGSAIVTNLPMLFETGMQIILELATSISQALPELIPSIVDVVLTIAEYLIENIDLLVDASIQLMMGLAEGLINALPVLIEKAPEIVMKLADALVVNAPKLLDASLQMIIQLAKGIITNLPQLLMVSAEVVGQLRDKFIEYSINMLKVGYEYDMKIRTALQSYWSNVTGIASSLMDSLKNSFLETVDRFKDIGKNIIEGIKSGIKDGWEDLKSLVKDVADSLLDSAKSALGIHSPSRKFASLVGEQIPAGIAMGIKNNMNVLTDAVDQMTNMSLEASGASAITSGRYDLANENYSGAVVGSGYNQTVNIYSPQALTPYEVARQTRNATRNMVLALQGV